MSELDDLERRMIDPDWMVSVFEWCPLAVVMIQRNGDIYLFNTAAEAMFGYDRHAVIGKEKIHILLPEYLRERHAAHLASYVLEPRVRPMGVGMTLLGMDIDRVEFPVEINLVPIFGRRGLLVAAYISSPHRCGVK